MGVQLTCLLQAWIDCSILESLHHPLHGLCNSLVHNTDQWKEYFQVGTLWALSLFKFIRACAHQSSRHVWHIPEVMWCWVCYDVRHICFANIIVWFIFPVWLQHPVALLNPVPGSTLQELSIFQKCLLWKFCCPNRVCCFLSSCENKPLFVYMYLHYWFVWCNYVTDSVYHKICSCKSHSLTRVNAEIVTQRANGVSNLTRGLSFVMQSLQNVHRKVADRLMSFTSSVTVTTWQQIKCTIKVTPTIMPHKNVYVFVCTILVLILTATCRYWLLVKWLIVQKIPKLKRKKEYVPCKIFRVVECSE